MHWKLNEMHFSFLSLSLSLLLCWPSIAFAIDVRLRNRSTAPSIFDLFNVCTAAGNCILKVQNKGQKKKVKPLHLWNNLDIWPYFTWARCFGSMHTIRGTLRCKQRQFVNQIIIICHSIFFRSLIQLASK